MIDGLVFALTLATALGCALIAGSLFAFSTLLMRGLVRLPAPTGITAMQAIDAAVRRSLFVVTFTGTAVACLAVLVVAIVRWDGPASWAMLTGGLLYLVGNVVVTRVVHLPRNANLHTIAPTDADSEAWWRDYTSTWIAWNHVRTVAALLATAALMLALGR